LQRSGKKGLGRKGKKNGSCLKGLKKHFQRNGVQSEGELKEGPPRKTLPLPLKRRKGLMCGKKSKLSLTIRILIGHLKKKRGSGTGHETGRREENS